MMAHTYGARTFKALSVLLSYPHEAVVAAGPALARVIESERLVPGRLTKELHALIDELGTGDLFDLQERYVLLFDRTRSLSLHLFEHVHGESRDRGQAMVDLQNLYARHGLSIDARELPDYLPLFLEYLSTRPIDEARALLGETLHIVRVLAERHRKRKSAYAIVFFVLEALAKGHAKPEALAELLEQPEDDPLDLEDLDRVWEEQAVGFGPDASCGAAARPLAGAQTGGVPVTVLPPTDRGAH